jgi:hypothetical protein
MVRTVMKTLVFVLLASGTLFGQSEKNKLTLNIVSIKPPKPGDAGALFSTPPAGRYAASNALLSQLMVAAYVDNGTPLAGNGDCDERSAALLRKHPITMLVVLLNGQAGRRVVDQTRLTVLYDSDLKWAPDPLAGGAASPPGIETDATGRPSLLTALQEQLGLRFVPETGRWTLLSWSRSNDHRRSDLA